MFFSRILLIQGRVVRPLARPCCGLPFQVLQQAQGDDAVHPLLYPGLFPPGPGRSHRPEPGIVRGMAGCRGGRSVAGADGRPVRPVEVEDKAAEEETAQPPEDSKAQELKAQDLKLQAQQLKLKAHEEYRVAQEAPIRVMQ